MTKKIKVIIATSVLSLVVIGGSLFAYVNNKGDEESGGNEIALNNEKEDTEEKDKSSYKNKKEEEPKTEEEEEQEEVTETDEAVEEPTEVEANNNVEQPNANSNASSENDNASGNNNATNNSGNSNNSGSNNQAPNPTPTPQPDPTPTPNPTPTPDPTPEPPARTWTYMADMSSQVFNLISQYRQQSGLPALAYNGSEAARAKTRAEFNASNSVSGHEYDQIAYTGNGTTTPAGWLQGWKNSPGHNANMLDDWYTSGGAAVYKDSNGSYFVITGFN